jgi:MoxR-like ATPase
VALVSGEAGVGKTRLADQVAATAAVHRLGLD